MNNAGGKNSRAEGRNLQQITCNTVANCGPPECCECIDYCFSSCAKQVLDAERLVGGFRGHEEVEGKGN
ncbi:unnamed protein product [Linum trigynum]|uniref:Uncharacterized protein n=1 Tax=Linum trigynum TaxID=586398 RepID=A0AAV2FHY4_9ROSI